MPNDIMKIIIEYKNKQHLVHEFSDLEVQICGLEMPVKEKEDGTEPNHGLIDWLISGGLSEVFAKPITLANKLIAKAISLGWFEANGEFSISSDPISCAMTIFKFPEYKSRAFIDNQEALSIHAKDIDINKALADAALKDKNKIEAILKELTK